MDALCLGHRDLEQPGHGHVGKTCIAQHLGPSRVQKVFPAHVRGTLLGQVQVCFRDIAQGGKADVARGTVPVRVVLTLLVKENVKRQSSIRSFGTYPGFGIHVQDNVIADLLVTAVNRHQLRAIDVNFLGFLVRVPQGRLPSAWPLH